MGQNGGCLWGWGHGVAFWRGGLETSFLNLGDANTGVLKTLALHVSYTSIKLKKTLLVLAHPPKTVASELLRSQGPRSYTFPAWDKGSPLGIHFPTSPTPLKVLQVESPALKAPGDVEGQGGIVRPRVKPWERMSQGTLHAWRLWVLGAEPPAQAPFRKGSHVGH